MRDTMGQQEMLLQSLSGVFLLLTVPDLFLALDLDLRTMLTSFNCITAL